MGIKDVMQIIHLRVDSLMVKARAEQKVSKGNFKILNILKPAKIASYTEPTDNCSKSNSSLIINRATGKIVLTIQKDIFYGIGLRTNIDRSAHFF